MNDSTLSEGLKKKSEYKMLKKVPYFALFINLLIEENVLSEKQMSTKFSLK